MHQCMTGLKDAFGYLCMKPTVLIANSVELLQPFTKFVCDGRHTHGTVKKEQQHWTWKFAQAVIDGIANLKGAITSGTIYQYPNASWLTQDPTCIVCKRRYVRTDPLSHTGPRTLLIPL